MINDTAESEREAANLRQYQELWQLKIHRDLNMFAREMETLGLKEGIAFRDASGGVQWVR